MMQQRVISTNVVATWLFDQGILQDLHCDCWIGTLVEITTQKTVDLVWDEFSKRPSPSDKDSMDVDVSAGGDKDEEGDSENNKTSEQIEVEFATKIADAAEACRQTYKTSIEGLVRACAVARSSAVELMEEQFIMAHPQFSTVFSQFKSTLRMFHENESELLRECTDQERNTVTLTAARDVIDTFGKSIPPEVEAYLLQFL
jgi:hypothetical protein